MTSSLIVNAILAIPVAVLISGLALWAILTQRADDGPGSVTLRSSRRSHRIRRRPSRAAGARRSSRARRAGCSQSRSNPRAR
jgi:hypothetical protein